MTEDLSSRETSLRSDVDASEGVLVGLERELKATNERLTALLGQGHQYELLAQVCTSLDALDELGAADLFWSDSDDSWARENRLNQVRGRVDEYASNIERVESERDRLLHRIGDQNKALDRLHYELIDVIEREESRKNEWAVEREAEPLPAHEQVMPWARDTEEDSRFRRSMLSSLAASLVVALLLGSIAIPIKERDEPIELPERVARLVHERIPVPKPEPQPVIEEEIPEPEPEEMEELVETIPDEVVPEPVVTPAVAEVDIREQVQSKGILAFSASFSTPQNLRPAAQLGSQASFNNAGSDETGRPTRSMVTSNAPGSSGGINLASISRNTGGGGGGMEGVEVSRVASAIGTGGGNADRPMSGGAVGGRTDEEIQIVFDRHKAALYRLYNRELRKNPTLRGQIVLKLTIEPDGSVSFCVLQSSDMNAPVLAEQVVGRVATFDFGAKEDIAAVTIIYPIDFLPAS